MSVSPAWVRILVAGYLAITAFCGTAAGQQSQKTAPASQPAERTAPAPGTQPALPRALDARLATPIGPVELTEAPLADVLSDLAQRGGMNLVVRWRPLNEVGMERDTPVTISLENPSLEQALWAVMNSITDSTSPLAYMADGDMLLVSTVADLGREMFVRAYDVTDLMALYTADTSRYAHRAQPGNQSAGAVDGGGGEQRGILRPVNSGEARSGGGGSFEAHRDERLRRLIILIMTSIEPDSWILNGGAGTIVPFQNQLVVRNSGLVHQQLGGAIRANKAAKPAAARERAP